MAIGDAISSVFGAIGDFQEASGYDQAASYAKQEAQYAKLSTEIQQQQTARQVYEVTGATVADTGGNNLAVSGSAEDVLRGNVQQGTLQKGLVTLQGKITETGYNAQAAADSAMASAANIAGIGGAISAPFKLLGTVICTELLRQERIPKRWYLEGAKVSAGYSEATLEGYHVWAVPSVAHLRAHPHSAYSRFLETIFWWYLENIAAKAGVKGAQWKLRGLLVTLPIKSLCFAVGAVRLSRNRMTNWSILYSG